MSEAELIEIEQRVRRFVASTESLGGRLRGHLGSLAYQELLPLLEDWVTQGKAIRADIEHLVAVDRAARPKVRSAGGGE